MNLRRSPLDAAHRAAGAKLVPFGGWEMPLSYATGTVAEHLACRHRAVAFDVSHLGTVRVTGPGAHDLLQVALTNDLDRIGPGRAQYSHLLDDTDASVLDDVIVWWLEDGTFEVMPNASNTSRVLDALEPAADTAGEHASPSPTLTATDVTAERAIIAIQGPAARALLDPVAPEAAGVHHFAVRRFDWRGVTCLAAGTGYTGEDGVEVSVPAAAALDFWEAVMDAGIPPAGLGARDTLRLEAGFPLHGHELGPGITPLQAGLGWVVAWSKPQFRGRKALEAEREAGVERLLQGLVCDGRQPPRDGYAVLAADADANDDTGDAADDAADRDQPQNHDRPIGVVTSGNFSPVLERGIALAFLPPELGPGARVTIDARGRPLPTLVVPRPFVTREK